MKYLSKEQRKLMRLLLNFEKMEYIEFWSQHKTEILDFKIDLNYTEMNLNDFAINAKSVSSFFNSGWKSSQDLVLKKMPFESFIVDLLVLIHSLIMELLLVYFSPNSKNSVSSKLDDQTKGRFTYAMLTYSNVLSALIECRNNYFEGKYLIGSVLFRYYSELIESNILALVDQEYFELIKEFPTDIQQEREQWKKIKPFQVRKRFHEYLDNHFDDPDFVEAIKTVSEFLYSSNSKSVHANFHNQFNMSFSKDEKNSNGEYAFPIFNIDILQSFFTNFIIYNHNILYVIFTAFITRHNLPMKNFGQIGRDIGFLFKYCERLTKVYLNNVVSNQ
jgi:hypothetical protein